MPAGRVYERGSVIYFEGDKAEKIFLVKSGNIIAISTDIQTGEEAKETRKPGDFLGVRPVLGHYTYEETLQVLTKSFFREPGI